VGAELLENQVPETLELTALAGRLGAPAASPFGGGFGGAVWALVRDVEAERFLVEWRDRYRADFPQRTGAEFFATHAGGPAVGGDA
jgi:galactokinase